MSDFATAKEAFLGVRRILNNHGGFRFAPREATRGLDAQTWAGIRAVGGLSKMATASLAAFARAYVAAGGSAPARPLISGRDRAAGRDE